MSILDNESSHSHRETTFWDGGSKTMFYTGLFLGVAATAAIAFGLLLSYMMKNGTLALAANNGNPSAPAAPSAPSAPTDNQPAPPSVLSKAVDDNRDHIKGAKNAKVTIVEYSDFECPFCERHEPSMAQALKDFPNDVRLVYRHYPLTQLHQHAEQAAESSECVYQQKGDAGFWAMHDKLFAMQATGLSTDAFTQAAKEIGVDVAKFTSCLTSGGGKARVDEDIASGNDSGVQGTPSTYINGKGLDGGAVPYSVIKAALQAAGAKG